MSAAALSSEAGLPSPASLAERLAPVRTVGRVALACARNGARTQIADLAEKGGYRLKFPDMTGNTLQAVIVNTGGGVAGGDRVSVDVSAQPGAQVAVSTATAERIYRSIGPATEIDVRLSAAEGATLCWFPQATILFSGARLARRFTVDVNSSARLMMAEATVFGRIASGEIMGEGAFQDIWRIRRDERLLFAETTRLDGPLAEAMARPAVMGGARSTGLLLYVNADAEDACQRLRTALENAPAVHGVSAWRGMLVLRVLAAGLSDVHATLHRAIETLTPEALPRSWSN